MQQTAPKRKRRRAATVPAVVIGKITAWSDAGPLVAHPHSAECHLARATVAVSAQAVGQEVALLFSAGDPSQPLIIGLLQPAGTAAPIRAELDGQRLLLDAAEEVVLRCGKASITLTKAGKVLIRGNYLLSRSSGVNRIKGGSVQIN